MVWIVRTYDKNMDSGINYMGVPKDSRFDTKEAALEYKAGLKEHSELFELDYVKPIKKN